MKTKPEGYTVHWRTTNRSVTGWNTYTESSAAKARAAHRQAWPKDRIVEVHRGPVTIEVRF
ncbi:MAG: hypothetical protein ACYDC1_11935 [Limisphaerales bacterium]